MPVFPSPSVGKAIPPDTPHSIIMCLPEWDDVVEVGKGTKKWRDLLEATYPRFAFQTLVKQVRYIL